MLCERVVRHCKIKDSRGQALVEMSIVLVILLSILFFMITIGFYIYNMIVFTYATNKALDRGVALLSRNNAENIDGISGNEFTEEDIEEIRGILLNASNIRMFSPDEPDIEIITDELDTKVKLTIDMHSEYQCLLPLVNEVLPEIRVKLTYHHVQY